MWVDGKEFPGEGGKQKSYNSSVNTMKKHNNIIIIIITNISNNIIAQAGSTSMVFELTTTSTLPVEVGRCRLGR